MPRVPREPKPPGTRMPCDPSSSRQAAFLLERFGLDPLDVDAQTIGEAAVIERFVQRLVGVLVARVFADDVNGELVVGLLDALDQLFPRRPCALRSAAGRGASG